MDEVMFPSELAKLIRLFLHGEREEREREEFRSRRIVKNDIVKWRSRCGEAICFLLFVFFFLSIMENDVDVRRRSINRNFEVLSR